MCKRSRAGCGLSLSGSIVHTWHTHRDTVLTPRHVHARRPLGAAKSRCGRSPPSAAHWAAAHLAGPAFVVACRFYLPMPMSLRASVESPSAFPRRFRFLRVCDSPPRHPPTAVAPRQHRLTARYHCLPPSTAISSLSHLSPPTKFTRCGAADSEQCRVSGWKTAPLARTHVQPRAEARAEHARVAARAAARTVARAAARARQARSRRR